MSLLQEIQKPPLTPPAAVFPIVWSILYVLIGLAAARVYLLAPENPGIKIFFINLVANFLWPVIFFNMRAFFIAFLWLIVIIAIVAAMAKNFFDTSRTAALLLLPYALWLIFAGYLNLSIYILNAAG